MADAHKNLAVSLVATAPSPATSGTSLVVTAGQGGRFPAVPFNATIWPASSAPDPSNAEIVRVTAISTDTLTIVRAQESTSARAVVVGDQIAATVTAKSLTDAETSGGNSIYGDASDGTVTFDGSTVILGVTPSANVYTQNRDWFFAAATINNGVTIITNGFRIYCTGILTNNGTIQWNGANGGNGTTVGGTGGAAVAGSNSSLAASNTLSRAGGAGGTTTGTAPASPLAQPTYGGSGGHGGAGSSGAGGTNAGSVTAPTTGQTLRVAPFAVLGLFASTAETGFSTSAGGGSGGGGGGDGTNAGGGGGSGAGIVVVWAKVFAGTGTISANGGSGGNGNGTGNTGGGGGGGGGTVVVGSSSVSGGVISGQTITATGGSAGTSHGTGGALITNGSAGTVILLNN